MPFTMNPQQYAVEYARELANAYPYLSYFNEIWNGPNSNRYKPVNGKTIMIPSMTTSGARAVNRDQIDGTFKRNWNNEWQPATMSMDREWDTLVDPMDVQETNMVATISNITKTFTEFKKVPEMDAYATSTLAAAASQFGSVDTTTLSAENILATWDGYLAYMADQRVNRDQVIAYMTPDTFKFLKEAAGITRFIDAGTGIRNVDRNVGKLDGVLEGPSAQMPVNKILPPHTDEQQMRSIAMDSMTYAAAGVTTANNGGRPTMDEFFLKGSKNGDLKIRVVIWPNGRNPKLIESYGKKRQGTQLDEAGKVFLGPVKLFADGSPQGYTAWFSKPYYKQLPGKPADFRGFPVFKSREELFALVQKLHDDGWQITTHTNGDQAIQDMIDAYSAALKANPRKDHRHILNHCQFCRPDQVDAIAEMGFVPSYFVTHTWFWGDIHRDMVAGPERAAHISPLKAALDKGITFALHNDTPVTPISPLMDVFSAVTRLTSSGKVLGPDQRITVMEALRGVTINGAYMQRLEDKIGSLEKGKLADLVILDKDPTKVAPETLKDIKVDETIVGGQTVYKRA